jgi:hypothetical protein
MKNQTLIRKGKLKIKKEKKKIFIRVRKRDKGICE